ARCSLSSALPYSSFQPPDPPRHLPSFPTRRSSDLLFPAARLAGWSLPVALPAATDSDGYIRLDWVAPSDSGLLLSLDVRGDAPRSEEHTSELQSRENLVCRLLLEKKKNKTRKMYTH